MKTYFHSGRNVLRFVGAAVVTLGIIMLCGLYPLRMVFAQGEGEYDSESFCSSVSAQCPTCGGGIKCQSSFSIDWVGGTCDFAYFGGCTQWSYDCGVYVNCSSGEPSGGTCFDGPVCHNGMP